MTVRPWGYITLGIGWDNADGEGRIEEYYIKMWFRIEEPKRREKERKKESSLFEIEPVERT